MADDGGVRTCTRTQSVELFGIHLRTGDDEVAVPVGRSRVDGDGGEAAAVGAAAEAGEDEKLGTDPCRLDACRFVAAVIGTVL